MEKWTIIFECEWELEIHYDAKKTEIDYWVRRRKEKQWSEITTAYWIVWTVEEINTQPILDKYEDDYYKAIEKQNENDAINKLKKLWYKIEK